LRYLLLLILVTLLALPATAAEILIIQSHSNQQYNQTVRQIQNSCGKKSQTYIMGDYAEFDLGRIVREEQPRLIVAVGDKPLNAAMKLRSIPVVYTMALAADESKLGRNITGVSMHSAPEHYLNLFKKLDLHRAGIVYSKGKSGAYIARAKKIAANYGVELVAEPIHSPQEVDAALSRLASSNIDSIWMIPDTTAVTAETLGSYFLMAQKARIPLISFSKAYLEKGALAILEASRTNMAKQLCGEVKLILDGTDPADLPIHDIGEASLQINEFIARKLNFSFSGTDRLFPSISE